VSDEWRVTVLGDGAVGKTAITVQFVLNSFTEAYDPTVEDAYRKQVIVDNRYVFCGSYNPWPAVNPAHLSISICHLEIVDTAGQGEYPILSFGSSWLNRLS
jgi:GTPase KRas protein